MGLWIVPDTCVSIQGLYRSNSLSLARFERNLSGFAQEEEPLLSVSVVEANEKEEILLDRDPERQEGDGGGGEGGAAAAGPAHQARARQGVQERAVNEISRNFRSSTGLLRML